MTFEDRGGNGGARGGEHRVLKKNIYDRCWKNNEIGGHLGIWNSFSALCWEWSL